MYGVNSGGHWQTGLRNSSVFLGSFVCSAILSFRRGLGGL